MSNRNGSTGCLENTERIFIAQNESYVSRISSVFAYARFCILFVRFCLSVSLFLQPPLKPLINTVLAVHSPLCARFGSASRNKTSNNKQQTTTTTTTTNKQQQTSRCQVPFHPSFPRPVFHHHCPPLPPSFAIAPITSMTVSILRSPYVPFFFDTCHCSLQFSPLTFNVPSNVSIRLLFRTPSARFSFPPRPSKSVYRNYSWPEATKII